MYRVHPDVASVKLWRRFRVRITNTFRGTLLMMIMMIMIIMIMITTMMILLVMKMLIRTRHWWKIITINISIIMDLPGGTTPRPLTSPPKACSPPKLGVCRICTDSKRYPLQHLSRTLRHCGIQSDFSQDIWVRDLRLAAKARARPPQLVQ